MRSSNLPNVKYLGEVTEDEKWALLELCKAFVFPSHLRSEAFGVALLEAARAGRPMISCELGTGTSFVNLNNVTGFVVAPNRADNLSEAMCRLAYAEYSQNFGDRARQRYEEIFTAQAMAARYKIEYNLLRS